jgi:hypothetical protein
MKIHKISHHVKAMDRGSNLFVRGMLECDKSGRKFAFHYEVAAEEDFDHEAHLLELERQGEQYMDCDKALRSWVGHKNSLTLAGNGVEIEITDCQVMFHAHSRWDVYCGWKETFEGQTSRHSARWPCKEPNHGPSLEEVQGHVYMLIRARLGHYEKVTQHRGVLNGLAAKHKVDDAKA